jgi:hypothetical protein
MSFHGAILFIGFALCALFALFRELASPLPRKNLAALFRDGDDCIGRSSCSKLVQLYARGDKNNAPLHAMFEYRVIASS